MLILVTANNLIQLFIGWESVGISSYLLISFWFTRILANKASLKAMILNRVGDICLLIAISVFIFITGTVDFTDLKGLSFYLVNEKLYFYFFELNFIDFVCFFLFFGAMGKSAQLFLHV
jgi:NADH-quinone oxidoreductase subunit L